MVGVSFWTCSWEISGDRVALLFLSLHEFDLISTMTIFDLSLLFLCLIVNVTQFYFYSTSKCDVVYKKREWSQTCVLIVTTQVLCIDEATASVDQETDSLIQQTIHTEFHDQTVLTIAHRINTILDSDRVMVMSGGEIVEFASPARLLKNKQSMFYSLVHGNKEQGNGIWSANTRAWYQVQGIR